MRYTPRIGERELCRAIPAYEETGGVAHAGQIEHQHYYINTTMKLHLPKGLKKALLACAAPAAVLIATFAPSAYAYSVYIPYGGDIYAGEHVFVFVIGEETTIDSSNSNLLSYTVGGNATSDAYTWCRYSLNESDDVITLSLLRTKGDGTVNDTYTFSFSEGYTTLQKGVVYGIKNAGAGEGNSVQLLQGGTVIATLTADCRMNSGGSSVTSTFNDTYAAGDFVWKATGTSAALDYTSENWENNYSRTLVQYGDAVFNASEDLAKNVNVGSKIDVNAISIKDDYTFTGTTDTAEIDAVSITIAEGKTLTVDGVALSSINDLSRVAGTNGLVLASGTSYLGGGNSAETAVSTQLEGTLVIKSGATLRLGYQGDEANTISTKYIDLSSLEGIELAGGTLASRVFAGDLGDINVTAASTLNFVDINAPDTSAVSIGTLTVGDFAGDHDLTLTSKWKSRVEVETLTGAGTVWFTCAEGDGAGRKLTVESVEGFTGKIHIENHSGNKAFLNVTIKDTETLSATQIEASNNSEVVIDGAGTYNLGNSAYLAGYTDSGTTTEKGSLANTWTGKVTLNGTEFTDGDLTHYGNANSTISLTGITGSLAAQTVESDVIFEGSATSGTPAVKLTSGTGNDVKFAGDISGNGNFVLMTTGNAITFSGDVSDWGGRLIASAAETELVYEGSAKEIKNDILTGENNTNATLNVTFKNTDGVTVNGDINEEKWSDGVVNLVVENASDSATGGVTFNGTINNSAKADDGYGQANITVKDGATATFTNGTVYLSNATVESGANLALTGTEELSLLNLTVKAGATMSVGANGAGTVVVAAPVSTFNTTGGATGGVVALEGGAKITGGLDLSNATTLQLDKMTGTDLVTVTGDFTLPKGTLTLSGDILQTLASLEAGSRLGIFSVGSLTLGDTAITSNLTADSGYTLDTVFNGGSADYYLGYTAPVDGAAGTVYIGKVVPEPTTATLSLLALAALAARRRRK